MRRFWKKPEALPPVDVEEKERRLDDAETRANVLFVRAEWLRAAVARRDAENHWQQSVNQLFLGGQP
jgi:hypothetical protein